MGFIWKVQCNDGTMDEGNPTKAPCTNNGGIKFAPEFKNGSDFNKQKGEIERQQILALEQAKFNSEKAMSDAKKNNTKDMANKSMTLTHIGLFVGGLALGYFAYKKFKK